LDCFYRAQPTNCIICQVEAPDQFVSPQTMQCSTLRSSRKLTLGNRLTIPQLIKLAIEYNYTRVDFPERGKLSDIENIVFTSDEYSGVRVSGNRSIAVATGINNMAIAKDSSSIACVSNARSVAQSNEQHGLSCASQCGSVALATGLFGLAASTGGLSSAWLSGSGGIAANTGTRGISYNTGKGGLACVNASKGFALNSGKLGVACAMNDWSGAEVTTEESIACALGFENKAKGCLGSWLVLVERTNQDVILDIQSVKVDGQTIQPDVWYSLKNSVIVEYVER